ncbi:MAG: hypothetical protein J3K34DRAFT_462625, partial [Monoraphidium minutum]
MIPPIAKFGPRMLHVSEKALGACTLGWESPCRSSTGGAGRVGPHCRRRRRRIGGVSRDTAPATGGGLALPREGSQVAVGVDPEVTALNTLQGTTSRPFDYVITGLAYATRYTGSRRRISRAQRGGVECQRVLSVSVKVQPVDKRPKPLKIRRVTLSLPLFDRGAQRTEAGAAASLPLSGLKSGVRGQGGRGGESAAAAKRARAGRGAMAGRAERQRAARRTAGRARLREMRGGGRAGVRSGRAAGAAAERLRVNAPPGASAAGAVPSTGLALWAPRLYVTAGAAASVGLVLLPAILLLAVAALR